MIHKTRGIVLKVTDYSESSVVARIFTEKFGLQSYMINGVKKAKSKVKMNMLQPLHLLDMVVYHKPNGGIQKISDIRSMPMLQHIPYDIVKSSIAIFINEILYKSLRQQTDDEVLFEFVFKSIELLDAAEEPIANFHLVFLVKLTRFLGFYPDTSYADTSNYFDLKNGIFSKQQPKHLLYITNEDLQNFILLLRCSLENFQELKITHKSRKFLIDKLIDYYSLHIDDFGQVKSHAILEEVLG
jgi:DNA repair protein RecO (recombination protein O)